MRSTTKRFVVLVSRRAATCSLMIMAALVSGAGLAHGQTPGVPPPTVVEEPSNAEIANSLVQWSAIVLAGFTLLVAVLTLGIAGAGVFGFREIRNARNSISETQREVQRQLEDAERIAERLERAAQSADARVEEIVRSAYAYNQGQEAYNGGNYQRAADFFRRASQLQPTSTAILYRLGRAYTNLDDSQRASIAFTRAVAIDNHSGEAYRGLALAARYVDPVAALDHARKATEVSPEDPKNWNCLGLLLRDTGEHQSAIDAHKRASGIEDGPITSFYLALLYTATRRPELAGEYIQHATRDIEQHEYYGRLKPLWAAVLRWSRAVFANNSADAAEWARKAASACQSGRRTHEVRGHMLFLLTSIGRSDEIGTLPDLIRLAEHHKVAEHDRNAATDVSAVPHQGRREPQGGGV